MLTNPVTTRVPRRGRSAAGAVLLGLAMLVPVGGPVSAAPAAVPDQAVDAASAMRFAHDGHKKVSVSALTSETSETTANPDGTWTLRTYAHPVRVKQGGTWQKLDTTLVRRSDGSIGPKAALVDLSFSPGGDKPVATLGKSGAEVGMTWPGPLPAPTLAGDTATYREVLPGVDLTVRATDSGYNESLVVKTREAAKNLTKVDFGLSTKGAKVRSTDTGVTVTDPSGAVLFSADASQMWDSTAKGVRRAAMAVDASDRHITIRPDQAFLADPATTYPVFLDPDHWCDSCGKQAHAVVQSGYATERNYNKTAGDLNNLKAGYETYDIAGTSRSYIQLNTAQIAGTDIKSASLNTVLLHSWNCDNATPTGLWLTDAINGDTTWSHQPAWDFGVSTSNVTNCNDARDVQMQFPAKDAAQFIADRHAPNVTFVLASINENSGTSSWRTFDLNPYLQVDFNSYPNTPQGMAMQGGPVPCVRGDNRPWVATRTPRFQTQASDPDGGALWQSFGMDAGTTGNPVPGTHHTNNAGTYLGTPGPNEWATAQFDVPPDWITADGTYTWLTSSYDSQLWSHDSDPCEFTVDSVPPRAPAVGMTGANPVTQGDRATFHVTTSMATPGLYDIDRFVYSTDGFEPQPQGSPSVPAVRNADGTASADLSTTAVNGNQNIIKVKAVNKAGTPGPVATCLASGSLDQASCSFHVLPLTPAKSLVGAWGFDETTGRAIADSVATTLGNTGVPGHPATLIGGANWVPGHDHGLPWSHQDINGYSTGTNTAITFDGSSGYVATNGPVVDTTRSFTVSAWVRLADTNTYHTVLSQDGNQASQFYLQYSKDVNAWTFSMSTSDIANQGAVRAAGTTPPALNVWTELTGTYDATSGQLALYVDGVRQGTATATGWASTGPFVVGAARWSGNRVDFLPGDIDSPQVWQRVLSPTEVHDLATTASPVASYGLAEGCATQLTSTTSRVPSLQAYWPFNETSGATAADTTAVSGAMTLTGGYSWGPGNNGNAVHLDGKTAYGMASGPAVDSSNSFTVSAWAKLDDLAGYYAVVTQHGTNQDAFQLRYSPDVNRWIFGLTSGDDNTRDNYTWAMGPQVQQAGQWTLVTGVFDRPSMQIKLYVNGKLQSTQSVATAWNAVGKFSVGSMNGGTAFFKGSVDQVQVWAESLTDDQVAALTTARYYDGITQAQGTASGGVSLGVETDGGGNPTGCAARFDSAATGQVDIGRPANLRNDRSYTVEGWANHTWTAADVARSGAVDPANRVIVGVNGPDASPLLIGYCTQKDANGKVHGKWFVLLTNASTPTVGWIAQSDADAADNAWTHLAATYDSATGKIALYVNGVRQNTFVNTNPDGSGVTGWNSTGNVFIGRGVWAGGQRADEWYGGIAGVRLYTGVRTQPGILADKNFDNPGRLFGISH